jgi:acyl-coenzyme A thioesterase PaaI-like protein
MASATMPVPAGYTEVFPEAGFNAYVGPVWRSPDGTEYLFDVREVHLNGGGSLHGGMGMALADIIMGRTVRDALDGAKALTISLSCDIVSGSKLGDRIVGRATITRRTRSIVFIAGELSVAGKPIMTATGIWKILGSE